jgi:hypothetical protein
MTTTGFESRKVVVSKMFAMGYYYLSIVVINYLKSLIYVSSVKNIAPSSEEPQTVKALHQHSKGLLAGLNALWNLVRWVACGSRNAVPWICPLELLTPSL